MLKWLSKCLSAFIMHGLLTQNVKIDVKNTFNKSILVSAHLISHELLRIISPYWRKCLKKQSSKIRAFMFHRIIKSIFTYLYLFNPWSSYNVLDTFGYPPSYLYSGLCYANFLLFILSSLHTYIAFTVIIFTRIMHTILFWVHFVNF